MNFLVSLIDDPVLWIIALLAGASFLWNGANRVRFNLAWPLEPPKDDPDADVRIPERRWSYDAKNLEDLVGLANEHSYRVKSDPALDFYVKKILNQSDIAFAVALAALTAYLCIRIALWPGFYEWINWTAWPLGAMAILYGVADIAEDLKLASILKHPKEIDRSEVAATNLLTRIKVISLACSVLGLVIFFILAKIQNEIEKQRRKQPTSVPPPDTLRPTGA